MRDAEITHDNGEAIIVKLWLYETCGSEMCRFQILALLVKDNPESVKPNRPSS